MICIPGGGHMRVDPPRTALYVDGRLIQVQAGTTVVAALYRAAGNGVARLSVTGEARAPLCGMGVCQECRVLIDGRRRLACQTLSAAGMRVETSR